MAGQRKPDKKLVGAWLEPADRRPIEKAAKAEGRTVSAWIRHYLPNVARAQIEQRIAQEDHNDHLVARGRA
jgi:hypothetical protein